MSRILSLLLFSFLSTLAPWTVNSAPSPQENPENVEQAAANYESQRRQLLTENFRVRNGKVRVAFFDADSTLRTSISGKPSANSPTDVFILPGVADKIAELKESGYLVAIVSNQGGVGRFISFAEADQALMYTMELVQKENADAIFDYYDFAEFYDSYRKGDIGMGTHLAGVLEAQGLKLDKDNSFMVGDSMYKKNQTDPSGKPADAFSDSDRKFAENFGVPIFHPQEIFGWTDEQRAIIMSKDKELDKVEALKKL